MSNSRNKSDKANAQPTLFAEMPAPASWECDAQVRDAISTAIKRCPKKRDQVAAEMSYLIGRAISVAMIDAFSAESKHNHRFPAAWLPAFCFVTGTIEPLRGLVERAGFRLIDPHNAVLLDLAEKYLEREASKRDLQAMTEHLLNERRGQ